MGRAEFLQITPRYYDALVMHHERNLEMRRRESDSMIAVLTAMVANTGFRSFEEVRQPKEFLPIYPSDSKNKPVRRRESFDQQMRRTMERAMVYQAGQVARGL